MPMWGPCNCTTELKAILAALTVINRKLDAMSEQQTELDTDVTNLTAVVSDVATQTATLGTDLTAVAAELASVKAANPALDLSGLETLITTAQGSQAALDTTVATATGMVPATPPVTPPAA